MRPTLSARLALRAIARYRNSDVRDHIRGCCRFTPSCSHYAEDALRHRAFPVALLLIGWRILRCNPLTRAGTVDEVRPAWMSRRQVAGVVVLSGLLTALVAGTASAATTLAQSGGSSTTAGGCNALIGGVPIGSATKDRPLQVYKGQRITLTGQAPASVGAAGAAARSTTHVEIVFIKNVASRRFTETATGPTFQRSVSVDTYLKYGSGVYRVNVNSSAPGAWNCSGSFYVELNGSKLAAIAAVTVGALGTAGMVAAANGDPPPPGDPDAAADEQRETQERFEEEQRKARARKLEVKKDRIANMAMNGRVGCLVGMLFALMLLTGAIDAAVPPPPAGRGAGERVWTRAHPVLGFLSGLFAGLGFTVALQQFGFYPLDLITFVAPPLIVAVLGAWRGWRGTAWKYVEPVSA